MQADYKKVLISPGTSLLESVKCMNVTSLQILLVVDDNGVLQGVVTDGDIRRALIENIDFNAPIATVMGKNPVTLTIPPKKKEALAMMKKYGVRHIPLLDDKRKVCGLLLWRDFFNNGDVGVKRIPNQVVIMAGGKGTRLDPFTKILPKPLIPVGEKPIIEHIMGNFSKSGFNNFLISLNYKAEMIKIYFSDNHHGYGIDYIHENKYLGTAGALVLAKDKLKETFIVSNCDVIIDTEIDTLFQYHKENQNHATILSTVRNIRIPYGVLKSDKANLQEIVEKPEYSFVINSGIYVLEPEIVDLISEGRPCDMPNLLVHAKNKGLKVQVYSMTSSWFDVGEWGEYRRAIDHMAEMGAIV